MLRGLFFASAAIALCAAAPAIAQPAASGPSWQGLYAGVNFGYGGDQFKYPFAGTVTGTIGGVTNPVGGGELSQNSGGFLGGGQVGYNYQLPNGWVLGAETDIDGTGIESKDTIGGAAAGIGGAGALAANFGSQIDYLGTVRARLGVPVIEGRVLPYVTGGLAYGEVNSFANLGAGAIGGGIAKSSVQTGWTVGVGADYAVTDRLSFRAEYLYADLGSTTLLNGSVNALGYTVTGSLQRETTANILRVGVNYRFGG